VPAEDDTFRAATSADGPAVRALVTRVLAEYGLTPEPGGVDRDLDDIEAAYHARGGAFQVVESAGQIVGATGLYPMREGVVELRKMYLAPEVRSRGLGRRLLEWALAEARRMGFRRVELETATRLTEALALYRRYGFREVEADHVAARCDLAMALDLEPMERPEERP
jgi:N-acetylglutamate synthase-like GNAT family acetyltransferase